jgi:hypothetical protein
MIFNRMKSFLDEKVDRYNNISFIENDPISVPHLFSGRQDREIMGFFAAILAWGSEKRLLPNVRVGTTIRRRALSFYYGAWR